MIYTQIRSEEVRGTSCFKFDGTIISMDDSTVVISQTHNHDWTVKYDNLSRSKVRKGQVVKAGEMIGELRLMSDFCLKFGVTLNGHAIDPLLCLPAV